MENIILKSKNGQKLTDEEENLLLEVLNKNMDIKNDINDMKNDITKIKNIVKELAEMMGIYSNL
jgi:hypothetical protein